MLVYINASPEKLLKLATSREAIANNPNLCHLLENPYLADDTNLAIHYNNYIRGYEDGARQFVTYFYSHGSRLDTGSLLYWRKKIMRDDYLYDHALDIEQNLADLPPASSDDMWGDITDCINQPCQYSSLLSSSIGSIGDTRRKYSISNVFASDKPADNVDASGDHANLVGDTATEMILKLPDVIAEGIMQHGNLLQKCGNGIWNNLSQKDRVSTKADAYSLYQAEDIGSDLKAYLASKMGDCYRMYNHIRTYNPYNPNQNMVVANQHGAVGTAENGNEYVSFGGAGKTYSDFNKIMNTPTGYVNPSDAVGYGDMASMASGKFTGLAESDFRSRGNLPDKAGWCLAKPTVYGGYMINNGDGTFGFVAEDVCDSGTNRGMDGIGKLSNCAGLLTYIKPEYWGNKPVKTSKSCAINLSWMYTYFRRRMDAYAANTAIDVASIVRKARSAEKIFAEVQLTDGQSRVYLVNDSCGTFLDTARSIPAVDIVAMWAATSDGSKFVTVSGRPPVVAWPDNDVDYTVMLREAYDAGGDGRVKQVGNRLSAKFAGSVAGFGANVRPMRLFVDPVYAAQHNLDPVIFG